MLIKRYVLSIVHKNKQKYILKSDIPNADNLLLGICKVFLESSMKWKIEMI